MKRKTLYQEIYDSILDEIILGKIKPGDKLKSENAIADEFDVSRITSKKALDMLADDGYIKKQPGVGSFVLENNRDNLIERNKIDKSYKRKIGLSIAGISEIYGNESLHYAYKYAKDMNIDVITSISLDVEAEKNGIRALKNSNIDGLIIMPVPNEDYNEELVKAVINGFPVVSLNAILSGVPIATVSHDNYHMIKTLIDHLVENGHKNIGYFTQPVDASMGLKEKIDAFIQVMNEHKFTNFHKYILDIQNKAPNYIFYDKYGEDIKNIQQYIKNNPNLTAVISSDYRGAAVFKEALEKMGKSCPEDISIVCTSEHKRFSIPQFFTHIDLNEAGTSKKALELINDLIDGKINNNKRVNIDFAFVKRFSVKNINKKI